MTTAPRLRIVGLHSVLAGPFDLELGVGECLAITGPSGAGKSLFLRMVADLDTNLGEVFLDGVERRRITAPAWRRQVVYNAAEAGWWREAVAEHFPGRVMDFARAMAPRLALAPELLTAQIVQLSTGERRVEAVLQERLAAGVVIAMVTHSTEQAARLGHRHLRMENRHLVAA
jgi:putative ABC transport system ATP-binding protein